MLIVGGATATGKSKLAVMLAKTLNGEIISADSMQIYKHMNIGTAKVTEQEMQGIVHHMINIAEPTEQFSVAEYQIQAKELINQITAKGKIPIIAGGTGLYINSLIYKLQFGKSYKDEILRKDLMEQANLYGNDFVYTKLQKIDPIASTKIHKNNLKRVIRAIEIKTLSGKSITDSDDKRQNVFHRIYAFKAERTDLYKKINNRVDIMFENGLTQEIEKLLDEHKVTFNMQSMQAIGYKEFKDFYNGEITLNQVKELIKKNSRNYAKRQYTWFKAYENCVWLEGDINNELCQRIINDYYVFKLQSEKQLEK